MKIIKINNPAVNCLSKSRRFAAIIFLTAALLLTSVSAQTTTFTFRGQLTDAGAPANGLYDFRFKLFTALTGGLALEMVVNVSNVQVTDGAFRVQLDFGSSAFPGSDRFLETSYSPASENNFTTVDPREQITSAPYSIRALNAATADMATNSLSLGGAPASSFVDTNDARLSDARTPLAGSNHYVQNNATTTQMSTDFNIGGTGTANILNAGTHFSISGLRVLAGDGATRNLFVGPLAGIANATGTGNTLVGSLAGIANTSGSGNSFFGAEAGRNTTSGGSNSFFGDQSGLANTTGLGNSYFGRLAGFRGTTGLRNTFVGSSAGSDNTTGSGNIGIGELAGRENRTGNDNIFIGRSARTLPTTVVNNSIAIGTAVTVSKSNTIVLGASLQETQLPGRLVVGTPFSTGGPLPGRGYFETFFKTSTFQGIYTPNVLLGSYTNNPRGNVRPCVVFQSIPGLAFGATLTNCISSFSSLNDKTDVKPFLDGLAIVKRLKPVAFRHKENGMRGIGLNAEDVAGVESSLIARDSELSAEQVSESGLIILLINSIKQQSEQIERLQNQVERVKIAICRSSPQAEVCKDK